MNLKPLAFLLLLATTASAQKSLVQYASTLQGTNSEFALSYGNTHPSTCLPFGMHAWSPQTGKNGNGWKYQYKANTIRGFQQTHQCSPWTLDYAVFSLFPETGELVVNEDKRASKFSHDNETAHPHYYKVTFDNKITTEIAPTERGAHLRFSFPSGQAAFLVLDGYDKLSGVTIDPKQRRITGWVNNGRYIPKNFRNYFVLTFDQPFEDYGAWDNVSNEVKTRQSSHEGKGAGAYIRFKKGAKVQVKVASSYISDEQAQRTLEQELKGNFDATKAAAEKHGTPCSAAYP
ncbi:hypothetical protein MKQ70_17620 [Chitinophaga sedimenti]|uniref:hypothetical protein n=1 Tax=Chitinophaga sedimenti TaxID=2033606 RepID=UPI0020047990|nr:hypothetical protein [Chitinophaga sedimenti]MCK7556739.1 hypothetical protein [Chitinophaga sedimenti]